MMEEKPVVCVEGKLIISVKEEPSIGGGETPNVCFDEKPQHFLPQMKKVEQDNAIGH